MIEIKHSLSDRMTQSTGTPRPSFRSSSWLTLGWCILALYFLTTFVVTEGREPTWQDELYGQSTGWSIAHGGPPNLSVNAIYPHNISVERFFGPVSFTVAAKLIRIFGLKVWPYRAVTFLFGISLMLVSTALLLRLAGRSQWIALAGASTVAVSSVYCIVLPGRWDPVTIGLVLAGISLLLYATEASWKRLPWQAIAAGILFGLAAGSTPRALPPLAAVGCGMLAGAFIDPGRRTRFLIAGIVAAVSAVATDALLLAPLGMTPWSWLRFVRSVSTGDSIDSSPLLNGAWNLDLLHCKAVAIITGSMIVVGFVCAWAHRREQGSSSHTFRVTLSVIALVTVGLTFLLVSRFFSYAIFWLPLVPAASFCWISWESLHGSGMRALIASLVGLELLIPASLETQRMRTSIKLWRSRDPKLVLAEIRQYIPPGSIVFGPTGSYFFAVEQSGSRYLELENDLTPGLESIDDSTAYEYRALDAAACAGPTFVAWPRDGVRVSLHDQIIQHPKVQLNTGTTGAREVPALYRVLPPENCSTIRVDFDTSAIKPFGPL